MSEQEFAELCKSYGVTVEQMSENLRVSHLVEVKSKIILELREKYLLPYQKIADLLGYYDRSGARQAYFYAIEKFL